MQEKFPSQKLEKVVDYLSQLPGVGRKTAIRHALYLLHRSSDFAISFSKSLIDLCNNTYYCSRCHNICDKDICDICSDTERDQSVVLVLENIQDVMAFERTGAYYGLYHVLGGTISPIDGIAPSDLKIESLIKRIENESIKEVVLAISPTPEGETTSFYIYKRLSSKNIILTRLSRGIAIGDELEYADEVTLIQAFKDRSDFKKSL